MSESLFRKPKKKLNVRQKLPEEEETVAEEQDDEGLRRMEGVRELQRTRERRHGLSAVECAFGKARAAELNAGGAGDGADDLQLSGRQRAQLTAQGIEAGIREQFEKETLLRDEDEELRKYIEKGLKGGMADDAVGGSGKPMHGDDILMRAANKLKGAPTAEERELLSNQMLAGIPEVDLGINARMTNILETERKKKALLEKAMRQAAGLPEPVPEKDPVTDRKRRRRGPPN